MYKFGEAVQRDLSRALAWYTKAAKTGYPPAQYHLGIMYLEGRGTEADRDKAREWLARAAANGFERAGQKLSELTNSPVPQEQSEEPWSGSWNFRLPNDFRYFCEKHEPGGCPSGKIHQRR
jgi:hypothetical protein